MGKKEARNKFFSLFKKKKNSLKGLRDDLIKEGNLIKEELENSRITLENIKSQFEELIVPFNESKYELKKIFFDTKKFIDADLHALYEKEENLKKEHAFLETEKNAFSKMHNNSSKLKRRKKSLYFKEKDLLDHERNLLEREGKLSEERRLFKEAFKTPKLVKMPSKEKTKQLFKKSDELTEEYQENSVGFDEVHSMIQIAKHSIENKYFDEARNKIFDIEKTISKISDDKKKKILSYEIKDLKTSLKLAAIS